MASFLVCSLIFAEYSRGSPSGCEPVLKRVGHEDHPIPGAVFPFTELLASQVDTYLRDEELFDNF